MRFFDSSRRKRPAMNMTPMIDVTFQLIIFFMCVSQFWNLEKEEVSLPSAEKAKTETEAVTTARLVVNLLENGDLVVSKNRVGLDALGAMLQSEADSHKTADGDVKVAVLLRADTGVEFKHVQDIMLACARAGIWQLSFAALKENKAELLE